MVAPASDRLLPVTRGTMAAFILLTALAVLTLFVLADQTARTFAWTIEPAATAAFLGGGYLSGTVLVVLSWARHRWSVSRVPMIVIGTFTVLTLLATLLHLDRFHFGETGLPLVSAWVWTAVYVVVPPAIAVAVLLQERRAAADVPRVPLPPWLRTTLLVEGLVLLGAGAALYLPPPTAEALWAWPLTPLTARAVGAWLLSYGLAAALLVRADDLGALGPPAVAYATFGAAELAVAARFPGSVDLGTPQGLAYLVVAVVVLLTGVAAFATVRGVVRRAPRHA